MPGIFLSLWLLCSLIKANQLMRKVVAQKRDYQASEVVAALLYIATNVAVVGWLTAGQRLYRSFLLLPPAPPITVRRCCAASRAAWHLRRNACVPAGLPLHLRLHLLTRMLPCARPLPRPARVRAPQVWQAVFLVLVSDSLVRFTGLAPKLLVVVAVQSWRGGGPRGSSRSVRRQARLLTLLEYALAAYRALVPIPVW